MNAFKSGLDAKSQTVPGESPEEFEELRTDWYTFLNPTTPEERYQVDQLIMHEWFQRRYFRIEAQLCTFQAKQAEQGTGLEVGEGFHNASTVAMRLHRRMVHSQKARKEARKEISRLRGEPEPHPQSKQTKTETEELASLLPDPGIDPSSPLADLSMERYRQALERKMAAAGITMEEIEQITPPTFL